MFSVRNWLKQRKKMRRERDLVIAAQILLGKTCPLCSEGLSGHTQAVVAAFKLGAEIRCREEARAKVLAGGSDALMAASANDPDVDVVYYQLLRCPTKQDTVLVEHFSAAGLYSEESATPLLDVSKERRDWLEARAGDWLEL